MADVKARLREELGDEPFAAALQVGRGLALRDAVARAAASPLAARALRRWTSRRRARDAARAGAPALLVVVRRADVGRWRCSAASCAGAGVYALLRPGPPPGPR